MELHRLANIAFLVVASLLFSRFLRANKPMSAKCMKRMPFFHRVRLDADKPSGHQILKQGGLARHGLWTCDRKGGPLQRCAPGGHDPKSKDKGTSFE
jgi:hypothetical protein